MKKLASVCALWIAIASSSMAATVDAKKDAGQRLPVFGWSEPIPVQRTNSIRLGLNASDNRLRDHSIQLLLKDDLYEPISVGETTITSITAIVRWECSGDPGKEVGANPTVVRFHARDKEMQVQREPLVEKRVKDILLSDVSSPAWLARVCVTQTFTYEPGAE